ncbi:hypothetical protein ACFV84_17030 [Kitasatospora sp. NPDC059811]|nr:hypothetical protein [Streptomyces sp. MJM8645]
MIRTRIAKTAAVAALVTPLVTATSLVTATLLPTPPLVSIDTMGRQ